MNTGNFESGDLSLQARVTLVSGASRGIGAGVALALARAGARVVGTATTEAGAQGITGQLAEYGGRGTVLDLRLAESIENCVAGIREREGAVQILVNNAGVVQDALLMRMKEEEWRSVLETDLDSVYRMSRAVVRDMIRAREGRIINIGSVVASSGNIGQSNYAAAKAGMEGFSRALALELGSRGVTVNTVAPGFIDTDMSRALGEQQREALLQRIPLGRLGRVEEVAEAVLYLAGKGGAYITGTTLHVNGGMYFGG